MNCLDFHSSSFLLGKKYLVLPRNRKVILIISLKISLIMENPCLYCLGVLASWHEDSASSIIVFLTSFWTMAWLCWFQTSLLLCSVIITCCFRVVALGGNAALALSPSGIAPKLNRIQLSAICRGGQSGKVIDLLAWRCLQFGHPSAASGACTVEQISSKRQCGKRQVSLKPALGCGIGRNQYPGDGGI